MEDNEETLISHIEALRKTVIGCLIPFGIILPFALYLAPFVFNYLSFYLVSKYNLTLNYFSPVEVFILQIKTGVILDLFLCFPLIMKKIWDFILPALYENERKFISSSVLISVFLFISGVIFCIFLIIPLILNFGISFSNDYIRPVFGISNVINLVFFLSLAFGLMFQIPIVTYYLIRWDILDYNSIKQKRPYVVIILLLFSAFLTPPDIISQLLLFIPTYSLFELGLLFSKKRTNE